MMLSSFVPAVDIRPFACGVIAQVKTGFPGLVDVLASSACCSGETGIVDLLLKKEGKPI